MTVRRGDIGSVPFDTSGRIRGLFTDRGSVVPLVRRAGLTAAADADGSETLTCVILRDGGRRFALAVDRAEKVESVSPDASAPRLTAHTLYTGEADDGDDWRQ